MPKAADFGFATGALAPGRLRVRGFRGREAISELSRFDVALEHDEPLTSDEIDALFRSPCALGMGPRQGDVVRGIVTRVRALGRTREEPFRAVLTMAPTMHLLTLGRTNRIYQNQTVPEIAATVLAKYRFVADIDYRIAVRARLPRREYVAQYEESDWDFLQRWLAHEGCWTWFEHGDKTDALVIGDANGDAPPIAEPSSVAHREQNNLATEGESTIFGWEMEQRRVPARVVLFDYNYRTPHVRLAAKAPADAGVGFGTVMEYGEHFKDLDEGERLARLRAERLLCHKRTYSGGSDAPRLRAGHRLRLQGHEDTSQDKEYILINVEHRGGEVPEGEGKKATEYERYSCHFEAHPADVQLRPERSTPWPSIHGIMHGHIAADGDGLYAEMDEHGRYRVKLPFDTSGTKGHASSRWIRMAQSYAGSREGSHHPLRRGAEVLVAFIDGDPDRPIIVGAVPNLHTGSPTTSDNATQAVLQTPSGIRVEMEDLATREKGRASHG